MDECIIVTGANGQVGSELVEQLRLIYGQKSVIALDIRPSGIENTGPFIQSDITELENLQEIFRAYKPTQVYHLAAILSAVGEQNPKKAWDLNMGGLLNILDCCVAYQVKKVFWPSSIAVFGPATPKDLSAQYTIMDPTTVYGISKLAGERWCEYYFKQFNLDVRSIRYPGIISWKTPPGGGTTDYAVQMYHDAISTKKYECYLSRGSRLPMIYMEDAIRATLLLMDAPVAAIQIRSSYNVAGISFTPEEEALSISTHIPEFTLTYNSADSRQQIADSWPDSIDDSQATNDWGWRPAFDLKKITETMLHELSAHPESVHA